MTDIIVMQGTAGTVHVADVDSIEEIYDLPAYTASPLQCGIVDPVDEDELFATSVDPHRQRVLEQISLGGIFPCTVQEHHRNLRREGHPPRPTKLHK